MNEQSKSKCKWNIIKNMEIEDKESLIDTEIVFANDDKSEMVSFGFIPYSKHPLISSGTLSVPDFKSMRSDDRLDARRAFAATYHKFEFTVYCGKNSKREKMYDCVNIITENGVWWGMVDNTNNGSGFNPSGLTSASNFILEEIENKESDNPFCVIYSGPLIRTNEEKDINRVKIISDEFGGIQNIPHDHPFFLTRQRLASIAFFRSGDKGRAVIASIKRSELNNFSDGKPEPSSVSPSFILEKTQEGDKDWISQPELNIKKLAMVDR
jgi:hypothetical protein